MRITLILLSTALILLFSCNPAHKKTNLPKPPPPKPKLTLPDSAMVTANSENVRLSPNGELWGKIKQNEKIEIIKRIGNWINFHSSHYDSAFIWAPSVGFNYLNLYNPSTYFDSSRQSFFAVSYFQELFGNQGEKRQDLSGQYQLFFGEIGLGSHSEIVMEVVSASKEVVKHGVTLFIKEKTNEIFKVKIDFFQAMNGLEYTLGKCDLPNLPPSEESASHIIWKNGSIYKGVEVDLERKEWKSSAFSRIWFTKIK